jgi:hypothetical protein
MATPSSSAMMKKSQEQFLLRGGLYEKGIFPETYIHQEYPKYCRFEHPAGHEVALIVSDKQQEADVKVAFEQALEVGLKFDPSWTKGAELLEQLEIHSTLAGRRAKARDPQAAAKARVERLRQQLAAAEADMEPLPAKVSRPRPLPVVAPEA